MYVIHTKPSATANDRHCLSSTLIYALMYDLKYANAVQYSELCKVAKRFPMFDLNIGLQLPCSSYHCDIIYLHAFFLVHASNH